MKKELTPEQLAKRKKINKRILLFLVLPVAIIWIIILLVPKDDKKIQSASQLTDTTASAPPASPIDTSKMSMSNPTVAGSWVYSADTDQLTSKPIYIAQIQANDPLELASPYDQGENDAFLGVRKKAGKMDAWIFIQQGQFMPEVYGENIKIRFDDDQPETFSCSGSADDDSRYLFFDSPQRLIAKLKKAKKVIVQALIYDNGNQQMVFNTEGFEWNH